MTMTADESTAERVRTMGLVWVDAVAYALVVTLLTTVGALVLGIASGGGFVRAKTLLFLGGFLLMAYSTIRLWPTSPSDLERGDGTEMRGYGTGDSVPAIPEETRFQSLVRAVPPVRWLPLPPPTRRFSPPGKLFLGSLFVLLTSYLMETVFGIT